MGLAWPEPVQTAYSGKPMDQVRSAVDLPEPTVQDPNSS